MALHVVTGAFGFSGRYITKRLLDEGHIVRTLTNSPGRANTFDGRVEAYPLAFDDPGSLAKALEGAGVLHNTYWVRFNHGEMTHASAVANTLCLFNAARQVGVKRVVHVSITNPSLAATSSTSAAKRGWRLPSKNRVCRSRFSGRRCFSVERTF